MRESFGLKSAIYCHLIFNQNKHAFAVMTVID